MLFHAAIYNNSRAAERPLAASLLALGHRRCLIVSGFSRGLRTTLGCFQLLTGKKRIQLHACSQGSALVESVTFHTKTCNPGKIPRLPILGYLRFIKINTSTKLDFDQTPGRRGQQEATRPEGIVQDTVKMSAGQRALLPTSSEFWSHRARQPKRSRDQSDNVGKASKDSTWFTLDY